MTDKIGTPLDLAFFNVNAPPKDRLRSAMGACGRLAEEGEHLQRKLRDPLWDENDDAVQCFCGWLNDFDEILETVEALRDDGDEAGAARLVACMSDLIAFKRDKLLLW